MKIATFNTCMLVGWLLVTIGGVLLNPGAGLAASGVLLIALTIFMARMGGIQSAPKKAGN